MPSQEEHWKKYALEVAAKYNKDLEEYRQSFEKRLEKITNERYGDMQASVVKNEKLVALLTEAESTICIVMDDIKTTLSAKSFRDLKTVKEKIFKHLTEQIK